MSSPKPPSEQGVAQVGPTRTDPPATELIAREDAGDSLEGYELIWKLAAGGQATAYVARDRALDRLVVLKRYHGVTSTARREAVLNEGRALARVRSPFVAPCYGVETRGAEIDLVVEYIPGRPLAELTADERSDTPRLRENRRANRNGAGGGTRLRLAAPRHQAAQYYSRR